jgi:cardiolipin synthase
MQAGHSLVLLQGGNALFADLVSAMDGAQRSVHLETYIFEFEGSALRVAEALERAALRGLNVRLVVDGIGTGPLPGEWQTRFDRAGVQSRVFSPLGRFGLLIPSRWRRLHRKLCVIDGVLGYCGGINLIDDHMDPSMGPLEHPRFDFAVRCTGPLVLPMAFTLLQLWWRMDALRRARRIEFRTAWANVQASAHPPGQPQGVTAQLVLRDNLLHRNDIERAYLLAIDSAQHEVVLANAYFVPGGRIRRALLRAAARGVRVRVLLQGRYESFMQYHAARPVYKQLLDGGIELQEYMLSALHAKVAVVDRRWATVGSSNLDPLSLLLAREANVISIDPAFATDLHHRVVLALENDAEPLDHRALSQRPWHQRALDRLAFGLMRALLYVTGHRY